MAAKKAKKASKTLGKKAMKKTKGGAVDMFLKFDTKTVGNTFHKNEIPNINFNPQQNFIK